MLGLPSYGNSKTGSRYVRGCRNMVRTKRVSCTYRLDGRGGTNCCMFFLFLSTPMKHDRACCTLKPISVCRWDSCVVGQYSLGAYTMCGLVLTGHLEPRMIMKAQRETAPRPPLAPTRYGCRFRGFLGHLVSSFIFFRTAVLYLRSKRLQQICTSLFLLRTMLGQYRGRRRLKCGGACVSLFLKIKQRSKKEPPHSRDGTPCGE